MSYHVQVYQMWYMYVHKNIRHFNQVSTINNSCIDLVVFVVVACEVTLLLIKWDCIHGHHRWVVRM